MAPLMIEDALLVWKLKCGDADALRRIYLAHKDRLLALAISLSGDRAVAEDALHDVFVALARSAQSLRVRCNLRAYLATCIANRMRNHWRRTNRLVGDEEVAGHADETAAQPDHLAMAADEAASLGQALQQLPKDQREVVILHLQGGLTFKAIAEDLDVSINTVQSRYRYGLEKLRDQLKEELKDENSGSNRAIGQGLFRTM